MRPRDPRYTAHPLLEARNLDATLTYVIARSPISDPVARYEQAKKMQRENLIKASENYFKPWESIFEGNPQRILERGRAVVLAVNKWDAADKEKRSRMKAELQWKLGFLHFAEAHTLSAKEGKGLGLMMRSVDAAYAAVERIRFEGRHYRRDIARRALGR